MFQLSLPPHLQAAGVREDKNRQLPVVKCRFDPCLPLQSQKRTDVKKLTIAIVLAIAIPEIKISWILASDAEAQPQV